MTKRSLIIFVCAFLLNLLWEHLHSALYVSYRGTSITSGILARAALFDAIVILLFSYPFFRFEFYAQRRWMLYGALVVFAVILEAWALSTGRWIYTDAMPIIPLLNVGLTPTIQLGMLGYLSFKASDFLKG